MTEFQNYIRDGAEIYRNSFAIIRAEADLSRFKEIEEKVVVQNHSRLRHDRHRERYRDVGDLRRKRTRGVAAGCVDLV